MVRGVFGQTPGVDLALRMPRACFLAKDHLNHKYGDKRALYLAVTGTEEEKVVDKNHNWCLLHYCPELESWVGILGAKLAILGVTLVILSANWAILGNHPR